MTSLFIYAFLLSLGSNLLIIVLSTKHNLFIDNSESDKPQNFHTESTPRAGGIGILLGIFLLLLNPFGLTLMLSILLAFLSGIFEDFHNSLSPRLRLLLQFVAALSAVWFTHTVVTYLGLGITLPYWVGVIFSLFAMVGMMNAVNIIDGFNGLASGVILLILGSFAVVSYTHGYTDLLPLLAVISGAILGFGVLNFPHGKIFLGDGGAYMLGFIVAVLGIFLAGSYEEISPWYILSVFIYPVWEVLFSIVRKKSQGKSPMDPDHLHMHMLIHRHLSKNNPLTALFILVAILPFMLLSTYYAANSIANIIIVLVFIGCYLWVYRYLAKQETIA